MSVTSKTTMNCDVILTRQVTLRLKPGRNLILLPADLKHNRRLCNYLAQSKKPLFPIVAAREERLNLYLDDFGKVTVFQIGRTITLRIVF